MVTLQYDQKSKRSKFIWHVRQLVWKSVTQRRRKWLPVLLQVIFSALLFLTAVMVSKPVFLTPVQEQPQNPITFNDIIRSLKNSTYLGFSPYVDPYVKIMERVADILGAKFMTATSEQELNNKLYVISQQQTIKNHIIWVIWKPKVNNTWKFAIRSTELVNFTAPPGLFAGGAVPVARHMQVGFLAVQMAVSEALLDEAEPQRIPHTVRDIFSNKTKAIIVVTGHWTVVYQLVTACHDEKRFVKVVYHKELNKRMSPGHWTRIVDLVDVQQAGGLLTDSAVPLSHTITMDAMPTSPLMDEKEVRKMMAMILLCYTLALVPPVMEAAALVVAETENGFKRAMRIRSVDYSCLYIGWLAYAFLTALPVCVLGAVALIVMFRWIWLFTTLLFVLAYVSVMTMLALIMAMFHSKPYLAAIWTGLFTLLQLFLAELLVHHGIDVTLDSVVFLLHVLLPPLGLVHGFNSFALLQTGRGGLRDLKHTVSTTILLWMFLILFYFAVLMLLQRTIGQQRAIGGQVSWKSIIFKKAVDNQKLRYLHVPTGKETEQLQEVSEFAAKAISFRHVYKSIMGVSVLHDINLDFYRGEYTMMLAERVQCRLLNTIEDLITGLTLPDKGVITVLGQNVTEVPRGKSMATQPGMIGYCHRSQVLIPEISVLEHLQFFTEVCMWDSTTSYIDEYFLIKSTQLLKACDLEGARHVPVAHLDPYYRAQLCWALALIMEPRIIYISNYLDDYHYINVINDKIVKSRGHLSVIKIGYATYWLHQADRVFYFDNKMLVFGGTPQYMFFKFGREYRVRMTVRCQLDDENVAQLLARAAAAGGRVRAHLGSLLILRMPTAPTAQVAAFIRDVSDNQAKYGITSLNVSLPDSEEVCRRAIVESRSENYIHPSEQAQAIRKAALERTAEPREWTRKSSWFLNWATFKEVAWKYICFYVYYRFYLIITIMAAIVTGVIIGVSLSTQLTWSLQATRARSRAAPLAVEALPLRTILVVKADNSPEALSLANAYVLSTTNAKNVDHMKYTAISHNESTSGYLVLRAIDSPQQYVYMYAYGMSVTKRSGRLHLKALFSPIHQDKSAAARSLARLYMALIRHYSGKPDADIQVIDNPLLLDASPPKEETAISPLVIQIMLIITISHITLLPSKEHGLIRHIQAHAWNSSPLRYWFSLFLCDLLLYWALVFAMSAVLFCVVLLHAPSHFVSRDLIVIPFVLIMYGLSCVPQAYLFSLGPSSQVNSMTFIIVNVVFCEATVISQIMYEQSYAERLLTISPQFNVATAFMRLTEIFVHNSECVFLDTTRICSGDTIHRCCAKCGVMQPCFKRISYFSREGVVGEMAATMVCGIIFSIMLVVWEYKAIQRLWKMELSKCVDQGRSRRQSVVQRASNRLETDILVAKKVKALREKIPVTKQEKGVDTFGEYLLVDNVSKRSRGEYLLKNVSLGIRKGEALALAGLKRHGRLMLGEIISGYTLPSSGDVYVKSKWNLFGNPHRYSRNVSLSFFECSSLPPWMTVYDALSLVAVLRGVPPHEVIPEVADYIDALELTDKAHTDVCRLQLNETTRLNFAAAAVGAPPLLVLDECTAYQKFSVNRAMYYILYNLRRRGHAIFLSSANVESHMPVTDQLAFLLDGTLFDVDHVDRIVARYSQHGYTVVAQLANQRDPTQLFQGYFEDFSVNDISGVLVSIQVLDNIDLSTVFQRMQKLLAEHSDVLTYVVTAIPLDFIYNRVLVESEGLKPVKYSLKCWRNMKRTPMVEPEAEALDKLEKFEEKYDITTLKELPWSVVFQT